MVDPDSQAPDVADALNAWRQDGETITHEALAFQLGVSVSTAARWCRGDSRPSPDQVAAMERIRSGLVRRLFPEAFQAEG
jgi:transcriptional regulator with XRE-family HTH domain